jgi:hypothetical protein
MVAVDQAANIGIQFQGKRQSGPAFIIWSIPTKRTLADTTGAKPAMLTEVGMCASMSNSWAATAAAIHIEKDSWRTMMSYMTGCTHCTRILYWSSPLVEHGKTQMGTPAEEDNARVLRENARAVAEFR